jgi:hypothetical protein
MVIALKDCLIYNVYMLPEQNNWQKWSETHPCDQLLESLTKTSSLDVPIFLMGDINARTASKLPDASYGSHASPDNTVNTRGMWLLRNCSDLSLHILNGLSCIKGRHNTFTSYQALGNSVIDYTIVNSLAQSMVGEFTVEKLQVKWSDHAAMVLHIKLPLLAEADHTYNLFPKDQSRRQPLPKDTALDRLLIEAISSQPDISEK